MAKMWAGRTAGDTSKLADEFNSSIGFDSRMYKEDITGSIAHARMLAKQGIIDIVENRLVGMKCRGVYETPGGTILYKAHEALESICLDKMTMHEKQRLSITFAELVYNGQWFTPLREALSAFVDKTQEKVTGYVKLKLYKGNIIKAGVDSPYSLYSEEIATFGESDYDQKDSAGFINLYGLPIKVQAVVDEKNK